MEVRFEPDLVELSGSATALLACAERKSLFLDGQEAGRVAFADVASVHAGPGVLVSLLRSGEERTCRFPDATQAELEAVAARLGDCMSDWR